MIPLVDMICEVRVARHSAAKFRLAKSPFGRPEFEIDAAFTPVNIRGSEARLEASLNAANDQLVLIRAAVDPCCLDEIAADPNVVAIYADSPIAPFSGRYGMPHCDDWLIDISAELLSDYSAQSYDGEPTQTRGCLREVAAYLGADQIWQDGISGDDIVIGVVDGGILAEGRIDSDRPGLVPQVIGGWPNESWGTVAGWRRHGNMMAIGALGMAPKALLYDIRISDSSPDGGRMSDAIAGIHWAIEKYRATGTPQVLCCGWGIYQQVHDPKYATDASHPLTRKIVEAMDEGILVLFAAGNGGESCPSTWCGSDTGPGKSIWGANGHPRVMTIGAVNKDEQLIGYSSQGPAALDEYKPDFCGISHYAGYFSSDSGTSAACAVSAGVVALLKQARPTLTQEAMKRLLKSTAKNIGSPGWNRHSGSGVIRAKAAYDNLVRPQQLSRADAARIKRLEIENRCLRDLFIELALDRKIDHDAPPHQS